MNCTATAPRKLSGRHPKPGLIPPASVWDGPSYVGENDVKWYKYVTSPGNENTEHKHTIQHSRCIMSLPIQTMVSLLLLKAKSEELSKLLLLSANPSHIENLKRLIPLEGGGSIKSECIEIASGWGYNDIQN